MYLIHYSVQLQETFTIAILLSQPGTSTLLNDALMQNPTFGIFWLGMEDIYSYAANGGKNSSIPSATAFENNLDSILKSFTSEWSKRSDCKYSRFRKLPFLYLDFFRGITLTLNQADSLNQLTGLQLYFEGENGFFVEYPKGSGHYRQMRKR